MAIAERNSREARIFKPWERPKINESTAAHLVRASIEHAKTAQRDGKYFILFTSRPYHAYIEPVGQPARDCGYGADGDRDHLEYLLYGYGTVTDFQERVFPRLMREAGAREYTDEVLEQSMGEIHRRTYGKTKHGLVFVVEASGVYPNVPSLKDFFDVLATRNYVRREWPEPQRPRRTV